MEPLCVGMSADVDWLEKLCPFGSPCGVLPCRVKPLERELLRADGQRVMDDAIAETGFLERHAVIAVAGESGGRTSDEVGALRLHGGSHKAREGDYGKGENA